MDGKQLWKALQQLAFTMAAGFFGMWLSLLYLKPIETAHIHHAELDKSRIQAMAQVIGDYLRTSYAYTAVAYDSCGSSDQKTKEAFNKAYDDFRVSQTQIEAYFAKHHSVIQKLEAVRSATGKFKEQCKNSTKDVWEPYREALKVDNRLLVQDALDQIGFYDPLPQSGGPITASK